MPKVIPNVRENLIREAKMQIEKYGYAGMTIRSVAKACNIGIGTIYNYFKSKEELAHTLAYEDWMRLLEKLEICCETTDSPKVILRCIYDVICGFIETHQVLVSDHNATKVFALSYAQGHAFLRDQFAQFLIKPCEAHAKEPSDFLPLFISEAVLVWTSSGKTFDEIYGILKMHFAE